jgi:hypothetical protein
MPNESIVIKLLIGRSEVRIPVGQTIFFFSETSIPGLGPTQPPIPIKGFFTDIKRPGRDVDQTPISSAEDKRERIRTSILPTCLHGVWTETSSLSLHQFSFRLFSYRTDPAPF